MTKIEDIVIFMYLIVREFEWRTHDLKKNYLKLLIKYQPLQLVTPPTTTVVTGYYIAENRICEHVKIDITI